MTATDSAARTEEAWQPPSPARREMPAASHRRSLTGRWPREDRATPADNPPRPILETGKHARLRQTAISYASARSQSTAASPELRTEMCPSFGRSHSSDVEI